jgi:5'-nucleotidase
VFCGVSSVALSAEHPGNGQTWRFESAARRVLPLLETVLARSLAQGVILNVNVPNLPDENVRGLRLTRHGRSGFEEFYTEQENVEDRGDEVRRFLLDGVMRHRDGDDDCADAEAVRRGWISVTPMTPCLDDDQSRRTLHGWPLFERR